MSYLEISAAKKVWLLGASTGGLEAIKKFLSGVPVSPEIAFIYAQHIADQQMATVLRMIKTQTGWPARLASTGQLIAPGSVTVISPQFDTRFCKRGWLLRLNSRWNSQYAPSIDRLAVGLAQVYKHNCGAIIFTGMGDDGIKGCQTIVDRGGAVWVQDPKDCTAPAMPRAIMQSNKVDFIGTVGQLVDKMRTDMEQMEACSQ
jgi:chemosensory pili system protein ChpB (putative protein-glutamate methylesterase)